MRRVIILGAIASVFGVGSAVAFYPSIGTRPAQNANQHQELVAKKAHQIERLYGFPASRTHASYIAPDNIEEMIQRAELIVIGKTPKKVTEGRTVVPRDAEGTIHGVYTEVPFKIQKTFKGNKDIKEIVLAQAAGVVHPTDGTQAYLQIAGDYTPVEPNTAYLMFLVKGHASQDGDNIYTPIGVAYGQHNLASDDEEKKFPDPIFKQIRKLARERFRE